MNGPESAGTPTSEESLVDKEAAVERIHSEEDILALMLTRIPGITSIAELQGNVDKRLSDEKGLTFLRVVNGDITQDEAAQYCYVRAGEHEKQGAEFANAADASRIDVIYYEDGIPCGSDQVAKFDIESGKWR